MRFVNVALLVCASTLARADTYQFTGSPFTNVDGSYTTSDRVTGFFSVGPLAANIPDSFTSVPLPSFSFSDGLGTISDSTPGLLVQSAIFTTGPDSSVTGYDIAVVDTVSNNAISFSNIHVAGAINGVPTNFYEAVTHYVVEDGVPMASGAYSTDPGTLVRVAPTPDPSSFAFLATGLLGGAGVLRRRYAMAP